MKTRATVLLALASFSFWAGGMVASAGEVNFVKSNDFKSSVLASKKPVLVDFFATWCGPCKRMAPIVEDTAQKYSGRLAVYKLDIDQSPDIAKQYSISAVPTLLIFKDGKLVDNIVGTISQPALIEKIDKAIQ
jgi:thioredoxin 1